MDEAKLDNSSPSGSLAGSLSGRPAELPMPEVPPLEQLARETRSVKNKYEEATIKQLPEGYDCSKKDIPDNLRATMQKKFNRWIQKTYTAHFINKVLVGYLDPKDTRLTPAQKDQLRIHYGDLEHDLSVATQYLMPAFEDNDFYQLYKHYIHPSFVNFPAEMLERFARNTEGKKVSESFDPAQVGQEVADFFGIYLKNTDNAKVYFEKKDIPDGVLHSIFGDRLDFKTALFNVVRNAQKRVSNGKGSNIYISILYGDNNVKVVVKDDTGGFDEELLEPVQIQVEMPDGSTKTVDTQKGLVRGVSQGEESGSGFGLDITRRVIEDQFGGKVLLKPNEDIAESGKKIGVVELNIPAK